MQVAKILPNKQGGSCQPVQSRCQGSHKASYWLWRTTNLTTGRSTQDKFLSNNEPSLRPDSEQHVKKKIKRKLPEIAALKAENAI